MINPDLDQVAKGDKFFGNPATLCHGFAYESFVLKVGPVQKRFGQDDRLVTVVIRSVDLDGNPKNIIDHEKLMWWSCLRRGLV
jgi:hypothetical protein